MLQKRESTPCICPYKTLRSPINTLDLLGATKGIPSWGEKMAFVRVVPTCTCGELAGLWGCASHLRIGMRMTAAGSPLG